MTERNTEHRPWGSFTVLDEGKNFKVKRIEISPGAELSLQYHRHRSESWTVVEGSGIVTLGKEKKTAEAADRFFIPVGEVHRASTGECGITFIEVQCGDELSEDDIVRLEDRYNRIADA